VRTDVDARLLGQLQAPFGRGALVGAGEVCVEAAGEREL
jgi:hypothetical protein